MSFAIFVGNIVLISLRVIPYNTKKIPITLKLILSVPFYQIYAFFFSAKMLGWPSFSWGKMVQTHSVRTSI